MAEGLNSVEDGIRKNLRAKLDRAKSVSSYLNRTLIKKFQKAQIERWQTQNASEGAIWRQIDPESAYGKWKRKNYSNSYGGGVITMIRTGDLSKGAQLRDADKYLKIVSDVSFFVSINVGTIPYAIYPGKDRPFMNFGKNTLDDWKAGIMQFIARNKESV